MKSSGDVRTAIAELLRVDLPRRCENIREAKGLSARELPDPGKVHSGQAPDDAFGDNGVTIAVTNPRHVPPMRLVDWTESYSPIYETRYACQIEIWALGKEWTNALAMRDEAESAVRAILIDYANLSLDPAEETNYAVFPPTVQAQFGYPLKAPNVSGRTWAPALVSVDIRAEERADEHAVIPDPDTLITGVRLWAAKVPVGERMPNVNTNEGIERIRELEYGEPGPVHRVGGGDAR